MRLHNATVIWPLLPDPLAPGDDCGGGQPSSVGDTLLSRDGFASGTTEQDSSPLGDRQFMNARPHSLAPTPALGDTVTLRFAELDMDLRSAEPDFDLCLTVSPVNVLVPVSHKFLNSTSNAGDLAWFKGAYMPPHNPLPFEPAAQGINEASDAHFSLQLLASQLQLHSLAARCERERGPMSSPAAA